MRTPADAIKRKRHAGWRRIEDGRYRVDDANAEQARAGGAAAAIGRLRIRRARVVACRTF